MPTSLDISAELMDEAMKLLEFKSMTDVVVDAFASSFGLFACFRERRLHDLGESKDVQILAML